MDAIQFIKQEHEKAKAAFAKLLAASPDRRGDLWNELQPELKAHEEIEEACLYGPIVDEGTSDAELLEWASDGHAEEVETVESLMETAESLDPKNEPWLATVQRIHAALEDHIQQEEGDIFPRVAKPWDQERLARPGDRLSDLKAGTSGRR